MSLAPLTFADPEPWADQGLCNYLLTPDAWHDIGKAGEKLRVRAREAIAICHQCPVEAECLAGAIERKERHGIWGGLTPNERERLKERTRQRRQYRARKENKAP